MDKCQCKDNNPNELLQKYMEIVVKDFKTGRTFIEVNYDKGKVKNSYPITVFPRNINVVDNNFKAEITE